MQAASGVAFNPAPHKELSHLYYSAPSTARLVGAEVCIHFIVGTEPILTCPTSY